MKSFFGTMLGTKHGSQKHYLHSPKDRRTTFVFSIQGDVCFDIYMEEGKKRKER